MNNSRAWIIQICKWAGMGAGPGSSSRRGGRGCRRDHLYCNSGALWISLSPSFRDAPNASHFLCRFFFRIPFIGFHLHLFLRLAPPFLIFALPSTSTVCLSCSSTTEFPFYALVKYFPWFYVLLFVRILLSDFSSCQKHFLALRYILRIVSFITGISDFAAVPYHSLLFSIYERLSTYEKRMARIFERDAYSAV